VRGEHGAGVMAAGDGVALRLPITQNTHLRALTPWKGDYPFKTNQHPLRRKPCPISMEIVAGAVFRTGKTLGGKRPGGEAGWENQ